mmetsp:Transcript_4106/g.14703  ORF Transcript_4106/g.14703 Transcript_4106/m.14703 type:complete len:253 (-) Transcript_4106:288-1046(-)
MKSSTTGSSPTAIRASRLSRTRAQPSSNDSLPSTMHHRSKSRKSNRGSNSARRATPPWSFTSIPTWTICPSRESASPSGSRRLLLAKSARQTRCRPSACRQWARTSSGWSDPPPSSPTKRRRWLARCSGGRSASRKPTRRLSSPVPSAQRSTRPSWPSGSPSRARLAHRGWIRARFSSCTIWVWPRHSESFSTRASASAPTLPRSCVPSTSISTHSSRPSRGARWASGRRSSCARLSRTSATSWCGWSHARC